MAESALLIMVRLLDGRFHGMPEWPPSPFRLYQALVAAALVGKGDAHAELVRPTFEWLGSLAPPLIGTPCHTPGRRVTVYVPNNDLDRVGGDPRLIGKIRAPKEVWPRLLPRDAIFAYVWRFGAESDAHDQARRMAEIAERLFQFGRGVDMAYASGRILDMEEAVRELRTLRLIPYAPSRSGTQGNRLRVPSPGSFQSLLDRHRANRERLGRGYLVQARPASFAVTHYGATTATLLFDLVGEDDASEQFAPFPATEAYRLVERVRDRLASLLKPSFGKDVVDRIVVGRNATESDKAVRIQIVPVPSIGSTYADHAIRRILLLVPPECPIPVEEIEWAAGIVHLGITEDGELVDPSQPQLVRATDEGMLAHYGIHEDTYTVWRTVTPVVLPMRRAGRRQDGTSRRRQETRIGAAIRDALRHAAIETPVATIRVQSEPFEVRVPKAGHFDVPERFTSRMRCHVEIVFSEPHRGPLLVGDGRYIGLGLFAPEKGAGADAFVFDLPLADRDNRVPLESVIRTARKALMSLAANARDEVPRIFSGHESDGRPAASGRHEHVFLAVDTTEQGLHRLLVIAPWLADRRFVPRQWQRRQFDRTVRSLERLYGSEIGTVDLPAPRIPDEADPVFGIARIWSTSTLYRPTAHPKGRDMEGAICRDVVDECLRRGLPRPSVRLLHYEHGPNGGNISAHLELEFCHPVAGPIILGRDSHSGGGLFKAEERS